MKNEETTLKVELTQKEVELIFDYRKIAPKWKEVTHTFIKVMAREIQSMEEVKNILDNIT